MKLRRTCEDDPPRWSLAFTLVGVFVLRYACRPIDRVTTAWRETGVDTRTHLG